MALELFFGSCESIDISHGSGGKGRHNVYAVVCRANVLHFSVSKFLLAGLLLACSQRATQNGYEFRM